MKMELLAPAGDLDAAYAAFHYGADAIYLGLKRFSARAEAANFTTGELSEIVAFAHAETPRRSVFVALNTLILDDEQDEAIETLATIAELGVDAVIVQDLGVARLVRRHCPGLALHASTQMAIHNVEGAIAARQLGFRRVTLARELTLKEVEAIVRESGLEVETFIHGALCYSYSGLCLYSSMLRERSGNRGRCAYPCRDTFETQGGMSGYPFSMKDLALATDVMKARTAGVFSFKIEGRKKSALYVAAVTRYYRGLLDKRLSPAATREAEEDIKTIFSRPWTDLYAKTARNRTVTDAEVVGHRGAPIGTVQEIVRQGRDTWVRFKTQRRIERHDGIQTDVPGQGRPFGFPVDRLRLCAGRGSRPDEVFEAPAHALIEVALPADHPEIEPGAPLYCSSSQAVKQKYRFPRPKPGLFKVRTGVAVTVSVNSQAVTAEGTIPGNGCTTRVSLEGTFEPSRDPGKAGTAVRDAFEKLGETNFELASFTLDNPDGLFIPVSLVNRLRREVMANLADEAGQATQRRIRDMQDAEREGDVSVPAAPPAWLIKVDRRSHLAAFEDVDWCQLDEVVLDIRRDSLPELRATLDGLKTRIGAGKIRLALPLMTREWEQADIRRKIKALQEDGWDRWEGSSVAAWTFLGRELKAESGDARSDFDLVTDWPVYVTNRSAARQVLDMGASRFTLSPEDGVDNMRSILGRFGDVATVIVYQDTPLFISENCALAAMARRCPAGSDCRDSERDWVSGNGETLRLVQQGCRTIAINQTPFSLAARIGELRQAGARFFRADFIHRNYDPAEVLDVWRALRQGKRVPGHEANYKRGMQ